MKKLLSILMLAVMLTTACAASASSSTVTDNVRFLPTTITVSSRKIVVDGYFVNMNSDRKLDHFTNFSFKLYHEGSLLASADFSGEVSCEAGALRMEEHRFTITGDHSLNFGTYECDDTYYAIWNGTLSSSRIY